MERESKAVIEQIDEVRNTNVIVTSPSSSSASDDQIDNNNNEKRKASQHQESEEDNSQSASNKRPKIVWNNALNMRFLDAIRTIGLERAVPKKILEVMNVPPGLTRVNVASHLQKYRILLRRVSNASFNIDSRPRHKFFGCFAPSDLTVPQPSFVPNTQNPYLIDGMHPSSLNPFPQSSFDRHALLNSNCPIVPNSMMGSSSTGMMVSGASCRRALRQENNGVSPYPSNYVGLSISSIKQLTELGQSSGSKASVGAHDHENNGAGLVGPGEDNIGLRQFCDVNGPSPALEPFLGCDENGFWRFDDLSISPLIISDLCNFLDGPLDLAAEVNNHDAHIADQLNCLNNPQTRSGFDNTVMSSGLCVGSSSNWMNNQVPTLDQTATAASVLDEHQHVRAMSGLYESSTQVNETFVPPRVNEPRQAHEVVANNNLNDQNMASNVNLAHQSTANNQFEIDDYDLLESFFDSPDRDDQTLDGGI